MILQLQPATSSSTGAIGVMTFDSNRCKFAHHHPNIFKLSSSDHKGYQLDFFLFLLKKAPFRSQRHYRGEPASKRLLLVSPYEMPCRRGCPQNQALAQRQQTCQRLEIKRGESAKEQLLELRPCGLHERLDYGESNATEEAAFY